MTMRPGLLWGLVGAVAVSALAALLMRRRSKRKCTKTIIEGTSMAATGTFACPGTIVEPTVPGPKNKKHKIKLVYFNGRGRAEIIRIALALAGVEYKDIRVDHETFAKLKKEGKLPFQQLPVIEFDGMVLAQSQAILRFLGEEFGLYGTSIDEKARIDVICEGWTDVWTKFSQAKSSPKEVQVEAVQKFAKEVLPVWMGFMTKLLKENNDGKGYFVGDTVSIADILSYALVGHMKKESELKSFPELLEHYDRLTNLPAVQGWIAKRPDTNF